MRRIKIAFSSSKKRNSPITSLRSLSNKKESLWQVRHLRNARRKRPRERNSRRRLPGGWNEEMRRQEPPISFRKKSQKQRGLFLDRNRKNLYSLGDQNISVV